jgi:hypothetical protein
MKRGLQRFRWLTIATGVACVPLITVVSLIDGLVLAAALGIGFAGAAVASLGMALFWAVNRHRLELLGFEW